MKDISTDSSKEKTSPYRSGIIPATYHLKGALSKGKSKDTNLFHSPCDKLYVQGNGELDLHCLETYRSTQPIGFLRGFSSFKSFRFHVLNADVFVYQNPRSYQLQLNPSQFRSYALLKAVLQLFLKEKFNEAVIFKIHVFTDIRQRLIDVEKSITVSFKRKTSKYKPAERRTAKSGVTDGISFTLGIGSDNLDCIKIYNSTTKHGLPDPSTRIERQFSKARVCPIKKLSELPQLANFNPFTNVHLNKVIDSSELKGIHLVRYKLLTCLCHKKSLHESMAELRRDNPKHFVRDYRRVLDLLHRTDLNLFTDYQKKWKSFLRKRLTKKEIDTLRLMGGSDV